MCPELADTPKWELSDLKFPLIHAVTTPCRYELKAAQNVRGILGQPADVRNSRVLKGPHLRTDPDFDRQVESAEASGVITEDESDELLLLDLIVSGTQTRTRERVDAGIEVSITVNDDDVNRAADRAEILRKVTGGTVMAAVIAVRLEAPQREPATRRPRGPADAGPLSCNRAQVSAEAGLPPSL